MIILAWWRLLKTHYRLIQNFWQFFLLLKLQHKIWITKISFHQLSCIREWLVQCNPIQHDMHTAQQWQKSNIMRRKRPIPRWKSIVLMMPARSSWRYIINDTSSKIYKSLKAAIISTLPHFDVSRIVQELRQEDVTLCHKRVTCHWGAVITETR